MNKDALIASLQKTNEAQARQLEIQSVQLEMQSVQLEKLSQQIEQLLRVLYGKKSEKSRPKDTRMTSEPLIHHSTQKTKKKVLRASNRTRLPDHIERIDVIHDIKAGEKQCPHCHQPRHSIGERASEQLDFVPAKLIVRRHRCLKYACRCGQGGVVQAPLPNQPIDKGIPGPGLLADIIVSKYQDHLPLYRQRLRFHRQGMDISDSTMGGWIREVAFMLRPIKMALKEELLRARKIHTDDTPIPVMAKGKTKKARLWTYLTDQRVSYPICVYDYTPTRHSKGPVQFLKNYQGYLQADAFSGYDVLYEKHAITEVGCMAHCRRKFFDVAEAAKGESKANDILKLIGELYGIEKHIKHWRNKDRYF
jgi:transposase